MSNHLNKLFQAHVSQYDRTPNAVQLSSEVSEMTSAALTHRTKNCPLS